jgi:hypothetical protein
MKEFATVTTSSPSPIPAAFNARKRASVPDPTPTPYRTPQYVANSFSKAETSSPKI